MSLDANLSNREIVDPLDPRDIDFIVIMFDLIQHLFTSFRSQYGLTGSINPLLFQGWNNCLDEKDNLFVHRMKEDGWCPWRLSELSSRLDHPCMAFVSNFSTPDNLRHDSCTKGGCTFNKLDQNHYRTKHMDGCSGCFDVVADGTYIYSILKSGFYPLVYLIDQGNQTETMKLTDSGCKTNYVAISHVWSDGLGNLQRNAIPHCQLLNLSSMIRSLPGKTISNGLFWLDTICCPLEGGDAQDLAVGMMRDTYEHASEVLVLDSFLLKHPAKHLSDAEVLLRITCSGWNSRICTLQKGALARSLFFQFADGPYELKKGLQRFNQDNNVVLQNTLKPSITKHFLGIHLFKDSSITESVKIIGLLSA